MRSRTRSAKQARLRLLGGPSSEFGAGPHGRFRALASTPSTYVAGLVVLGIGLGVVHNKWHHVHRPDPVVGGAGLLLFPAQVGATHIENAGIFAFDSLFAGKRLKDENLRLQAQVAQLQQENESLRSHAAEADRLRAALAFSRRIQPAPLLGEVVGWLPSTGVDTITVARGSHDGVRPGAIARTAAGLVGQVTEAGPVSSQVLLLTDISSNVGALVRRNGRLIGVGIVRGSGRDQSLTMEDLRGEDDVRAGDQVVSSGYGGVFPPDIPIGSVSAVTEDKAQFVKTAIVQPAAPLPGDLREVFLFRPLAPAPGEEPPSEGDAGTVLPRPAAPVAVSSAPAATPPPSPTLPAAGRKTP